MERNISKGFLLIQKFAEKYTNVILQKLLNIKSKKTIDKRKKIKKNAEIKRKRVLQIIEKKKQKNEEYKEEKKKKLDNYLMNQEKELDFLQNYAFCNKVFLNEKDNFFGNSDDEEPIYVVPIEQNPKGEQISKGEQNENIDIDNEANSLNPFQFKFVLEKDKTTDEDIFLFKNEDPFDDKKNQKIKPQETELEQKPLLEQESQNYYFNLFLQENMSLDNMHLLDKQNESEKKTLFSNGHISCSPNEVEENPKQEKETNKNKRKFTFDIDSKENKKECIVTDRYNRKNEWDGATCTEHQELELELESNNKEKNILIGCDENKCDNDSISFTTVNDLSEQNNTREIDKEQNKQVLSNTKYTLVFGNCNFENLKNASRKSELQKEEVKTEKEEKANIEICEKDEKNLNTEYRTSIENRENEAQKENIQHQHKQDINVTLMPKNNTICNVKNNLEKDVSKDTDTQIQNVLKDYKDDFEMFNDLNIDNSFDLFFNDLEDPPSIFKK